MSDFSLRFLLIISSLTSLCSAFNFEPRLPVIKQGPVDSYFGFSVAEHVIADEARKRVSEALLLVGAPRAQSSQPGTNHSGVVFKCSLSTLHDDCTPLRFDQDEKAPDPSVSRDDQWLGVTVRSQGPGGYVMACAHRYVLKGADYQWGQGVCYSLTQYLDYQRTWEPCFNRPVNKAHEQYGYCQAGTSADISEENDIVIGTPGPYTWRGTIFTNSIRFGMRDDKAWYSGPLVENAPVDKYSYLGMSVASGKFFDHKMSYVGGAPRANGKGQVIFYSKPKPAKDTLFNVQLILNGEQFGSSFGYTLIAIDVNGDKKLDLVVGAPFFYNKSEGGAVYVYLNSQSGLRNDTFSVRLTGKPESRFGFALTSLGDINKDGFNDLAVGAPYEEDGGAVYVYLGSKDGLKPTPVQIIKPNDLPYRSSISKTFGYSLSGSMDIDQNGYPDLLVGSYEDDAVALLRGRPIIKITNTVKGDIDKHIDPTRNHCDYDLSAKAVCFRIEACFKLNSPLNLGVVKLAYRIEAETFTGKKYYRVKFRSTADTNTPNIVEKDIVIRSDNVRNDYCSEEIVFLKDKSDIQSPLQFLLTYSLVQKDPEPVLPGDPLPDINKYPILDQEEARKVFSINFLKDCGPNEICETDLQLQAELILPRENGEQVLHLGAEHVTLELTVHNRNEPACEANVFITHPNSLSFVQRKAISGDQVECLPVNGTILKCELGNPFPKRGETKFQLKFNPKSLADEEQSIVFHVLANTTSTDTNPERKTKTLSAKVFRTAEIEIVGSAEPDQIFYGGEPRGESSMRYEEDIGGVVSHSYVVTNRGPWRARRVEVIIEWPFEVENYRDHGKWLLYLLDAQVQGNGYCETGDLANPLKLKKKSDILPSANTQYRRRPKRDLSAVPEELREDGKVQNIVLFDCYKKTAKCARFSCNIADLKADATAVVKIRARLWNSTFVEDYAYGVSQVHIHSHARVRIDPALDIRQRVDNDNAYAKTKAYPDLPLLPPQDAPLWAYVLATILGLLLLVVLVGILWKLGFFERKKYAYLRATDDDRDGSGYN